MVVNSLGLCILPGLLHLTREISTNHFMNSKQETLVALLLSCIAVGIYIDPREK